MLILKILLIATLVLPGAAKADLGEALKAYRAQDYATAARLLKPLADQGEPNALNVLAWLYSEGMGVPKDDAKAFRLYERAADEGHVEATFTVGLYYDFGKAGVRKDRKKAFRLYQIAAKAGYSRAQFNVGHMLVNGDSMKKNVDVGVGWLLKAALQGDRDALGLLGSLHFQGKAPNASSSIAWTFLDLASRMGKGAAGTLLDILEARMTAVQITEAKRLQAEWLEGATFATPPPRKP